MEKRTKWRSSLPYLEETNLEEVLPKRFTKRYKISSHIDTNTMDHFISRILYES